MRLGILVAIARVVAVGLLGAVSWKLLRIEDRDVLDAALGYGEIALLIAALVWPVRALNLIVIGAPVVAAVVERRIVHEVAWVLWCTTVIGLAAMVRSFGSGAAIPEARSR